MPGLMCKRPIVPYMFVSSLSKARYKLRRNLVQDVEGILHRYATYLAELRFCAQFAHFRLRDAGGAQPFTMMRQRGCHTVEHTATVEESTEQPHILLQFVGAVDFQAHIAPTRSKCIADGT